MKKIFIIQLLAIFLLYNCVEAYQRYFEAICVENSSSEIFPVLNDIIKSSGFILLGTQQGKAGITIISNYDRYDDTIKQRIRIGCYLTDNNGNTEILFTVGSQGLEDKTRTIVNNYFDSLMTRIEAGLLGKFRIVKISRAW